mgnify:CR=1 FL=1
MDEILKYFPNLTAIQKEQFEKLDFLYHDWNEKINKYVRGFMIESYLEDGRQDKPEVFGKSITDPCLGWDKTENLINEIYQEL